ncbi:hypothetical protein ACHQM5_020213 [Ranunculus cassubicifolius]
MARACVGFIAALASATLTAEHAYADGPFNLPLLSNPSPQSSSNPNSPPPQESPKENDSANVRNNNNNRRAMAAGFDPETLERGVELLKVIEASPDVKKIFELIKATEATRRKLYELKKVEAQALSRQFETERHRVMFEAKKKLTEKQAQTKSQMVQYEDELARKRLQVENENHKARNRELVEMQEQSTIRQEQLRRQTEAAIQELRIQTEKKINEEERATIEAREMEEAEARSHEAKETEDINRRMLKVRLEREKEKLELAIKEIFQHIGGGLKVILTDQNKLIVAVGGVTALAAGVYSTREGAKVVWGYVERILGQPSLIRESSRGKYPWSGFFSRGMSTLLHGKSNVNSGKGFGDVILNPSLKKRVEQLARATANTKSHQAPFRNMLFYGPPGTGKTMAARELAQQSGLDYALMTGGDVAPLGAKAVTKIHQLFDWSKKSRRGLLLFIDEADAFLNERNKAHMSEAQRSALNALLFRTGDQSKDIVLALATNRPGDLDSAVSDRIDEVLEFPLPGEDERFKLLQLYLDKYIARAGENTKKSWFKSLFRKPQKKIEMKGFSDDVIREAAAKTDGFSGREIAKLMAGVQSAVYGTGDCVLDSNLFREVVDYKVAEHQQRRKFASKDGNL